MPNRLLDLDVESIHLVDTPAIKRRFLVVKRGDASEEEIIQEIEKTVAELSKAQTDEEKAKLSDAAKNAIKGAVNLLNKYKDELPDAAKKALDALTKLVEGYGYGYAAPKKELDKAGAALSAARRQQIESVINGLKALAGDLEKMLKEAGSTDAGTGGTPKEAMEQLTKMLQEIRSSILTPDDLSKLLEAELARRDQ